MNGYEKIKKYCESAQLDKFYEIFLYHKFEEDYYNQILEYKKNNNNQEPDSSTKQGYESTLLSDSTLSTNIMLANSEKERIISKEIKKVKRKTTGIAFLFNVLAGILASVIFTIMIVVLFTLGQNQIMSWLNDFYVDNKQIEEQMKNNE